MFLGIDVGTGSVRAGIFDARGVLLGAASREIKLGKPQHDFVEQSSEDIWRCAGEATREALKLAGLTGDAIQGIGFDATCSLVVLDTNNKPVTVSPTGDDAWNVIVWMDHRAIEQANRINAGKHDVLRYVGGVISPEMETPKLLWLKENAPKTWQRAARFFDLPDFLVYRATGNDVRSLCTTVCKWTYLGHESRWDDGYFRAIGLGDLADEKFARIGTNVRPMGERAGTLTEDAARELGLVAGIRVGVSIIDAHAGGIGTIGAPIENSVLENRVALIGGTSSCHMAVSRDARFVPGVWGPYASAMIPGLWLTEGGQSATGALIDHVIFSHARGAELRDAAKKNNTTAYALLNERLAHLAKGLPFPALVARDVHVLPDHHGNRSPRANPSARGMIAGLTLADDVDALAIQYLATIQGIAHGTRHVLEAMNQAGYAIDTLVASGGDTKNPVFLREHADVTGCRIALPEASEGVLLGSAILGAVAAGAHASIVDAMAAMTRSARVIEPARGDVSRFHDNKHRVFLRMYDDQIAYRALMQNE